MLLNSGIHPVPLPPIARDLCPITPAFALKALSTKANTKWFQREIGVEELTAAELSPPCMAFEAAVADPWRQAVRAHAPEMDAFAIGIGRQ